MFDKQAERARLEALGTPQTVIDEMIDLTKQRNLSGMWSLSRVLASGTGLDGACLS